MTEKQLWKPGGSGFGRRAFLKGAGLGLGALALPTALSSCSSGGAGRGKSNKPLQLWNFYSDDGSGDPTSTWWLDVVEEWNSNNDVKVELRYIPTPTYMDGTTLQTAFTAGEGPDIFLISPGDFLRFANGGVLEDLSNKVSDSLVSDFTPGLLEARSVDGKVYGIPFDAEPLAIYYSVEAFEQAGLSEGDIPTTWEDFAEIAGKLTTQDRYGALFETNPGYYQNFTWYPFMWQGDGDVFDDNGNVTFDHNATIDALSFWGDLVKGGYAARSARGEGASDVPANLAIGATAMQQSGIWGVMQLQQENPDFEYGVFKLPTPEGGTDVTCVGGWALCANSKSSDPDAAADFVVWAMGAEDDEGRQRLIKWNTEAKSNLPARQSVIDAAFDAGVWSEGALAYFADEIVPTGRAEPRYPAEVYKPISDAIQAVQLKGDNASNAADIAHRQIEQFMQGYDGVRI